MYNSDALVRKLQYMPFAECSSHVSPNGLHATVMLKPVHYVGVEYLVRAHWDLNYR